MNKNILLVLVAVVVIVGGYYFWGTTKSENTETQINVPVNPPVNTQVNTTSTNTPVVNTATEAKGYTLAEVAKHNKSTDCWTAVSGNVYDVTDFIPGHPGGKDIIKACGKDGTSLFKSERDHVEQNAMGTLEGYFIGKLSN